MPILESWFSLGIWTLFLSVSISILLILFMNRYGTRWLLLYFGIFLQLPKISLSPTRFSNIVFGRISFKPNVNRSRLLDFEFLHSSDTRKLLLWIRKNTENNTWLFSCSLITISVNRRDNTQYRSESNAQDWYKKAKIKMNLAFYWIRTYILDISIEKCLIIKCTDDTDKDTRIVQTRVKRASNMFYIIILAISSVLQYTRKKFKHLVNNLIQKWSPHLLLHFSASRIDYFKSINNNLDIIHVILSGIDFKYKPYKAQVIVTSSGSPKKFFFYQNTLKLGSLEVYHQDYRIIFSQKSLLFMDLVFQVPITNQFSHLSLNYFSIQFGELDFQIPSESWIENQLQLFFDSNSNRSTNGIMSLIKKESDSIFIHGKCEIGAWKASPIDNHASVVYFQIFGSVATWNDSFENANIVIKGISSKQNQFSTLIDIPEIIFNVNYKNDNILMISCSNNPDKDSSNISITLPLSLIQRYYDMIPTKNTRPRDSKSKALDIDIKLECLVDVSIITRPHKMRNSIYENTFRYKNKKFQVHFCIDKSRNLELLDISFDSINISCDTIIKIINDNEKAKTKPINIQWTLFELLGGFKFAQRCHKSTKTSSLVFGTIKLEPLYSLEYVDGNSYEKILPSLAILLGQLYYFKATDSHSTANNHRYSYHWESIDIKKVDVIIPLSDRKIRLVWEGASLDKNLNIGQLYMTLTHQDHVLSKVLIPEIDVICDSLYTIKLKDDTVTIELDMMDLIYMFTIVNIHVDIFYTCCCIEPYNSIPFVYNINESSCLKLMMDIQDDIRWANSFLPLNMNSNNNAFILQIPMIELIISLPTGPSNIVEEIIIYLNQFSFGCNFDSLIWGLDLESISIKASTDINNSKESLLLNLDTVNIGNIVYIPDRSLMMDFSLKSWKEYLVDLISGSTKTKNDSNLLFPMFILDPSSKVSRPSIRDCINGFKNSLFKMPPYCSSFVSIQNLQIISPFNFPIYNIIDIMAIMVKMFKKKWLSNLIIDNSFSIESTKEIFLPFSCIISCSFIRIQCKKDKLHALLSKKSVTLSKRLQRYHLEKQLRENVFWSKVLKDMQYIYDIDDSITTKDEHSETIEQIIDGMLKKSNSSFKSLPIWIRASQNPNILVKNKKIRDAYYQFLVLESSNWIHSTRKPVDNDEEILSEILIKELNLSLFPPISIIDSSFYLSSEMINYLNKLVFSSSSSLTNFQMHELFELFKNVWCCTYCSSIEMFLNKAISREPFVKVCDLYGEGLISVLEKYRTVLSTFKRLKIDQYIHPITESWSCIHGSIHPVHLLHLFQINMNSLSIRWNLLFQNHQLYEWSIYCIDALNKPTDLVNEPCIATLPLSPWDKARWIVRSPSSRLIVKKNFWAILDFGTFNEIWIGSQDGACLERCYSKVDTVFQLQSHIKVILRSDRFPMLQHYLETEQGFKIWDELQFKMEFDGNEQILNLPIFKMHCNIEFEIVWNISKVTSNWINNYNIMCKYLKCYPNDQSARIQMEALRLPISHNDIQSVLLVTLDIAQQLSLDHYDAYDHFRCTSLHLVIRSITETKQTDPVLFCYYPEISHFFQNLCPWISTLQDLNISRPLLSLEPSQIIPNKKREKFSKALKQIYLDKVSMPEMLLRYVRFVTSMENDETRVQFISFLAKIEKMILDCWLIQGNLVFLQTEMSHVTIQLLVDLQEKSPVDHISSAIDEDEYDDDWLFDLLPSDIQKEQRYRFPKLKQYPFVYIPRLVVYKMIRTEHTHQTTLESCNPFVKSCYKLLETEFEHLCQMLIETDPKDNLFTFKQIKKEIHMIRERKEFMMNHLQYFLNSEDDLQNVSWSNTQHWITTNTCIRWNATFRNALFNLFELISDEAELMQAMKRGGIQKLLRKEINEQSKKLLSKSGIKHKISSLDEMRVVDALIERLKAQEQATQDESLQLSDPKDDAKYLGPMGHSDELEMLLNLIDQTTLDLLRILSRIHIHFVECQIAFEEPASSILLTTDRATLELGYWVFKDSSIESTKESDKLDQIDAGPAIEIIRKRTFFLCEGTELWVIHKKLWIEKRMKRLLHVLSVLTEPGQVEPSYQTLTRVPFMEGWPPFQFRIANEIMVQNEEKHDPDQDVSSIHSKILEKSRLYVHYETRDPRLPFNVISDSSLTPRHKYIELSSQNDILSLADRLIIQFLNEDWKLTTTSLDYCSIYNIITLLFVYSDPNRRARHEKIKEYLLSWQEGISTTSKAVWNEFPIPVFSLIKNDDNQEMKLDDDVEVILKSIWNALITRLGVEKFKQGESLKEKLKSQALSIQSEMLPWISLFRSINRFIDNINDRQHWLKYAPYWTKKSNSKHYDEIIMHNRQEFIVEKHKLVLLWYFLKNVMYSNHAWMWLKKSLTKLSKKGSDSNMNINDISASRFQVYASTRLLLHIPKVTWTLLDIDGNAIIDTTDDQYQESAILVAQLADTNITFIQYEDASTDFSVHVQQLSVRNVCKNAYYDHFIQPLVTSGVIFKKKGVFSPLISQSNDSNQNVEQPVHIRFFLRQLAPVGGISIIERVEINICPTEFQLTYDIDKKLFQFLFPERGDSGSNLSLLSNNSISAFSATNIQYTAPKKTIITSSSESNLVTKNTNQSSRYSNMNTKDLEEMKYRASHCRSFIAILVPSSYHCVSYKGRRGDASNIEDIEGVILKLDDIEYKNKTWSWYELIQAIKKDSIRLLLANTAAIVREKLKRKTKADTSDGSLQSINRSESKLVLNNKEKKELEPSESEVRKLLGLI